VRRLVPRALPSLLLAVGLALAGCSVGDDSSRPPQLGAESGDEQAAAKLGFPASATKNTVRVGGGDAASDAAGVASALYPATGSSTRPTAVVLVEQSDWQAGITASVLAGPPIGAPLLLSDGDELPAVSRDTLERLKPTGSDLSRDAQVIRIGQEVARPDGYKLAVIEGDDPYERAARIDRFFSAARGRPSRNVVVVSGESPEFAMPAAAWAARSGNAVLPVSGQSVPPPIRKALREHERPNIYVLGPERVIGKKVVDQLEELGRVRRIEGRTPVQNAIAFARFERAGFGWGVTVPGYNFTVASTSRPLDAASAAPLATRGVFAPLLLTDRADELPRPLEDYFLSVQPGYEDDPGQAVYNRVWILGDDETVSVAQQARLDQITELVPVQTNAP
jgi:putative cell wall binding repeat protein